MEGSSGAEEDCWSPGLKSSSAQAPRREPDELGKRPVPTLPHRPTQPLLREHCSTHSTCVPLVSELNPHSPCDLFEPAQNEYLEETKQPAQESPSQSPGKNAARTENEATTLPLKIPIDDFNENQLYSDAYEAPNAERVVTLFKPTKRMFKKRGYFTYRDKNQKNKEFMNLAACTTPYSSESKKFFQKRYYLFSKFDKGIMLDEESWYSVTPEEIARHIAKRVSDVLGEGRGTVLDAFCGVGGNTIQFARKSEHVIAVDVDQTKKLYCETNAKIYNVRDKITLLMQDYLKLTKEDFNGREIDAVFLSPPWGGTGYNLLETYSLEFIYPSFHDIMMKSLEFSSNVIVFLPRNTCIRELTEILTVYQAKLCRHEKEFVFEVEKICYNDYVKCLVVYTGVFAKVNTNEIAAHIESQLLTYSDPGYQKRLLRAVLEVKGAGAFARQIRLKKKDSASKILGPIKNELTEDEAKALKLRLKHANGGNGKTSVEGKNGRVETRAKEAEAAGCELLTAEQEEQQQAISQ